METNVFVNGKNQTVILDMVKEIRNTSILFSVGEIDCDVETINYVKEIVESNKHALFAIDTEKRILLFEYEVPENQLTEELMGECDNV